MKKIIATGAAIIGLAVGCSTQPAFADDSATTQPVITQIVDTTAPGTDRNGWIWWLPDGTTMGVCAAGYVPQWNTVHDYQNRVYWATVEQPDGSTKGVGGYTWATWSDRMKNSGIKNPIWYGVGDLGGGTETTNPVGYQPQLGELDEGDCAEDGTALPTPNDHFDGSGKTYPIISTTPAKPKPQPVTYQHDTIRVVNKAQAAELAKRIHDGVLPYRGDTLSWGHSTWSFVTTPVVPRNGGHAVVGQTVDLYWAIDTAHGAKPVQQGGLAWGPKHNLPQHLAR